MRVHTLAGRQGAMWASHNRKKLTEGQKLEKNRIYNKRYREKNRAKGLTASGKPRKDTAEDKARKQYQRDWYRNVGKINRQKKRIQIVYPDPLDTAQEQEQQAPMNHCPKCGQDLNRYNK